MTYQEVLDYWMEQKPKKGIDDKLRWAEITIAIKRQIPQKPTFSLHHFNSGLSGNVGHCPSCPEHTTLMYATPYCPNCGQAIDWSDEE